MSCILAIDDRPINRQFLVSLLGYGGHKVLEASDGEEGLAIVRQSRPDLVITDIKMPRVDGYEFVERLSRDPEPRVAATPVIFYTAQYHELEADKVAESHGVADIITKPAEPEEILRKVSAVLGRWNSHGPFVSSAAELEALQATGLKLNALVELGMEISSEHDVEKLLGRFCSTARHIIGVRKSMLGILSADGASLEHFHINGLRDTTPIIHERPDLHHPVLQSIVSQRKALLVNNATPDSCLEELSPYHSQIRSFLGVPIMSVTGVYGWLVLLEKQNDSEFTEDDERMATTLAAQAAIAYENLLFAERLQRSADELDRTRREQLELKDQFISHVSHELRSPLTALHQFTTILLDGMAGDITDEQREYLEIVLKNSLQLRDMIGDLLEVTRASNGKLHIEPRSTSLCDLCRSVGQTYERRAGDKEIVFRVVCGKGPHLVWIDPNRIRQVLSNLLDNALKFTSHGEISIGCSRDNEDGAVRFAVADTGCGIDEAALQKIFDRLYQSPNTMESSRKGLGLGLHISKQLVELHGGRIWAQSEVGKGTTVFFTVPVAAVEEKNLPQRHKDTEAGSRNQE